MSNVETCNEQAKLFRPGHLKGNCLDYDKVVAPANTCIFCFSLPFSAYICLYFTGLGRQEVTVLWIWCNSFKVNFLRTIIFHSRITNLPMNPSTTPAASSETRLLLLLIARRFSRIFLRWSIALLLGITAWVLFDPLPPLFFWGVLVTMLGAMSLHTVLHQKSRESSWMKQACRYAFFLSFPMLFVFGGNRLAMWCAADASDVPQITSPGIPSMQGVVASEEYLMLKALQKEQFKDPVKAQKGLKKFVGKQLQKAKQMDGATRALFIILGIILLIVIIVLIAVLVGLNQAANSCAGGNDNEGCI